MEADRLKRQLTNERFERSDLYFHYHFCVLRICLPRPGSKVKVALSLTTSKIIDATAEECTLKSL